MAASKDDKSARFGLCLKRLRLEHGQTQSQLAELLGISFQQVGKYERGIDWMSVARIEAVCKLYGVGLDYFFEGVNATKTGGAHDRKHDVKTLLASFSALPRAKQQSFMRAAAKILNNETA